MYEELVKALRETRERVRDDSGLAMFVPPYQLSAAADAIEALCKQNAKWEEIVLAARDFIPCWIPTKKRMPEILDTIIVAGRMRYKWQTVYFRFVDVATYIGGESFETFNDWYEGQDEFEITHWMALPNSPEDKAIDNS